MNYPSTPFNIDLGSILESPARWSVFDKKVKELSPALIDLLTGAEPQTNIIINDQIGQVYHLSLDQMNELSRIIRDIVLGDMFIGDMRHAIMERLQVDENTATSILNAIVTNLFSNVSNDLKKIQRERFPERVTQTDNTLQLKERREDTPAKNVLLPKQNLPETIRPSREQSSQNTIDLRKPSP